MDQRPPSSWRNWSNFHRCWSHLLFLASRFAIFTWLQGKCCKHLQWTNQPKHFGFQMLKETSRKTPRSVTAAKTAGSDVLYLPPALRDPSLLGMEEAGPRRCHAPRAAKGQERWVDGEFPRPDPPDPRNGLAIWCLGGYRIDEASLNQRCEVSRRVGCWGFAGERGSFGAKNTLSCFETLKVGFWDAEMLCRKPGCFGGTRKTSSNWVCCFWASSQNGVISAWWWYPNSMSFRLIDDLHDTNGPNVCGT